MTMRGCLSGSGRLAIGVLLVAAGHSAAFAGAGRPVVLVERATGLARALAGMSGSQAALMARRGAEVVGARNLLAGRSGVPGRMPGPGPRLHRRVHGVLRGQRYITRVRPDGWAVATVERHRVRSAP
ncbi:MAG: hypothetical protein AMXMBFR13_41620 [Phycisphaerae bacterium]